MKKRHFIQCLVMLTGILFLFSCGGGSGTGGAPGSSGAEDTGIVIRSVGIIGLDQPQGTPDDIDVALHLCEDGTIEEGLFREDALMTINATLVNPGFNSFPATVEECSITYLKSNDDPSSPIIESWTVYPNCALLDEEENECRVQLLDIQRKRDFWDDFTSGLFVPKNMPTRYIASYSCKYYNIYREKGFFSVEYEIFLADFDTC